MELEREGGVWIDGEEEEKVDGSLALEVEDAEWEQEEQLKVENAKKAADQSVENHYQETGQMTTGKSHQMVVTCSHHPQSSKHFSLPPPHPRVALDPGPVPPP